MCLLHNGVGAGMLAQRENDFQRYLYCHVLSRNPSGPRIGRDKVGGHLGDSRQHKDYPLDNADSRKPTDKPPDQLRPSRRQRFITHIKCYFECRRTRKRQETAQDRAARRTANATVAIAAFTLATIGVGISQFVAMRRQQNIMQGQLDEMRAEQRATIAAGRAMLKGEIVAAPKTVTIGVDFDNIGKQPATDLSRSANPKGYYVRQSDFSTDKALIRRAEALTKGVCDSIEPQSGGPNVYSGTVGLTYWIKVAVPQQGVDGYKSGHIAMIVPVCFAYRTLGEVHKNRVLLPLPQRRVPAALFGHLSQWGLRTIDTRPTPLARSRRVAPESHRRMWGIARRASFPFAGTCANISPACGCGGSPVRTKLRQKFPV